MSESESELVVGRPELQHIDVDAFLFLVERTEDGDLLFAKESKASSTAIHY